MLCRFGKKKIPSTSKIKTTCIEGSNKCETRTTKLQSYKAENKHCWYNNIATTNN
eukprot:m.287351 g.287351  ORF g.287351 m.287351 type:complete len:55 (-) comp16362_c1_seq6:45-209(-)